MKGLLSVRIYLMLRKKICLSFVLLHYFVGLSNTKYLINNLVTLKTLVNLRLKANRVFEKLKKYITSHQVGEASFQLALPLPWHYFFIPSEIILMQRGKN